MPINFNHFSEEQQNAYIKGITCASNLVKKAIKERDKKGYRENLGYDSKNKLVDFINKLNLHYTLKCDVIDYFDNCCDNI